MKSIKAFSRRLLSYFALRYYIFALFIAYIFLSNIASIAALEGHIVVNLLQSSHISAFYFSGNIFVGSVHSPYKLALPIYSQILFLMFFPTISAMAKTSFKIRAKILCFGALCFVAFIAAAFLTVIALLAFTDISPAFGSFVFISYFPVIANLLVTVVGAMVIELSLFFSLTLPGRSKVNRIVKRSYFREYAYLLGLLVVSSMIIYSVVRFLQLQTGPDSPLLPYITLNISITAIQLFVYFLAYFVYEARTPKWLNIHNPSTGLNNSKAFSISFLIPAYNEEKLIGRCIESMDSAASNYAGKTEIVIVNDGSTDRTGKIVREAIKRLKYSTGTIFDIPNSGKGYACRYGLQRASGDIIFRTDADSVLDKNAIVPMMNHFRDPLVGSVSAVFFPLEKKSIWQKGQALLYIIYIYIKMAQELVDSIITQPGASTAYRKDALMKAGGWLDYIFGEDGELTNRMARLGYKAETEPRSIVYTDLPESLHALLQQRSRWSVAFYHSRGRNLELVKDYKNSRSVIFLLNLLSHGAGFGHGLIWPFLIMALILGINSHYSLSNVSPFAGAILIKLAAFQLVIYGIEFILLSMMLKKTREIKLLAYFPVLRLINVILPFWVKLQALSVLLSWSSKWRDYDKESFENLRKEVKRSIDPGQ